MPDDCMRQGNLDSQAHRAHAKVSQKRAHEESCLRSATADNELVNERLFLPHGALTLLIRKNRRRAVSKRGEEGT